MTASEKKQLMANACKVRMGVIESTYGAKSGHPGRKPVRLGSVYLSVLPGDEGGPRRPQVGGAGTASSFPRDTPPPACTPPWP